MTAVEALAPAIPPDVEALTLRVLRRACDLEVGLATAESCTGGLIASLLTDVPGCSHVFDRGFVTYSEASKRDLLGVPEQVLREEGAVSAACALAMAEGALRRSAAGVVLAVTGYADPQAGTDAGLTYFLAARRGGRRLARERRFGPLGRAEVRLACLRESLGLIEAVLN